MSLIFYGVETQMLYDLAANKQQVLSKPYIIRDDAREYIEMPFYDTQWSMIWWQGYPAFISGVKDGKPYFYKLNTETLAIEDFIDLSSLDLNNVTSAHIVCIAAEPVQTLQISLYTANSNIFLISMDSFETYTIHKFDASEYDTDKYMQTSYITQCFPYYEA